MDDLELKRVVEAALFVAARPLLPDDLVALFPEDQRPPREKIREVLTQLSQDCAERGIELREIDHGFRFQTRPRYAEWVNRLFEERPPKYSRAVLETLAIIAYRQPVTRAEIEDIRGVGVSTEIVKARVSRHWIRQVGQKEVPGRPALYGTTRAFLEYFNLRSLEELPSLTEIRALDLIELDTAELTESAAAQPPAGELSDVPEKPETDGVFPAGARDLSYGLAVTENSGAGRSWVTPGHRGLDF